MLRRTSLFYVAILALGACRESQRADATVTSSSSGKATMNFPESPAARIGFPAPSASQLTPPAGPNASATVGLASFHKGVLNECVDFVMTPPAGAGPDWKPDVSKVAKDPNVQLLKKACGETFEDRPAIASCTVPTERNDAGATTTIIAHYYNVSTLAGDDTYMRDCLKAGGDWKAAKKDSDEYRAAARSDARRRAESLLETAGKLQDLAGH